MVNDLTIHLAERTVLKWSISSRVFTFILQIILNLAIEDYDSSACCLRDPEQSKWVEFLLPGTSRWDSVYFLKIASTGYAYEQYAAFFPLWPMAVTVVARTLLLPLSWLLCEADCLQVSAALVGSVCFCGAAYLLFHLSYLVTRDLRLSITSALLFCVNPALVFFNATYTASMFACLSFASMFLWARGFFVSSAVLMSWTTCVRSNGLLLCGFMLYEMLYARCTLHRVFSREPLYRIITWRYVAKNVLALCRVSLVCCGFYLFQKYIFLVYCSGLAVTIFGANDDKYMSRFRGSDLRAVKPGWCRSLTGLSYGHIQDEYWNVGFLRYFEAKQIPNFALASPAVLMTACFACAYGKRLVLMFRQGDLCKNPYGLWRLRALPYAVHWVAFVLLTVFNIHVQVLTRLVASALPAFYWYSAYLFLPEESASPSPCQQSPSDPQPTTKSGRRKSRSRNKNVKSTETVLHTYPPSSVRESAVFTATSSASSLAITLYFLVYAYLGLALHTNFYPWT